MAEIGSKPWGVFPHAEWTNNRPEITHRGFVVRRVDGGVPYSRMRPIKVFARESSAQKYADSMNSKGTSSDPETNKESEYGDSAMKNLRDSAGRVRSGE